MPTPNPVVPSIEGSQALPPRASRRIVRRPKRRRIARTIALIVILLLALVGGYVGWKFIRNTSRVAGGNLLGLLSDTKLKGEDQGRVNILLAGNSADDPGHGGSNLTDSIMVLSVNTKNNTAFMLSIPRDMWVDVPDNGHQKINAAYADGQAGHFNESGYPSGGMGLLEKVVEQDFGLHIDYYALTDYTAFKQAVNAVGGIDVNIRSSDPRGIYDPNISKAENGPLILKNGLQHLDGQTALNLARARNDPTPSGRVGYGLPGGDFDRAANQRLMLAALKTRTFSSGVLANPVKIGQLLDALGNNVTTNFQTNELRRLYDVMKPINTSNIQSLSLTDKKLIQNYTASDGEATLVPTAGVDDYSQIELYLQQLTSNDPAVKEAATITVLNGSGVSGAAKKEANALTAKGLDVVSYTNASQNYPATTIINNAGAGKPATLSLLKSLLSGSTVSTTTTETATTDFVIILGADSATN